MNEDNVIDGVVNYLKEKNRHRDGLRVLHRSHVKDHDKGIDLKCVAYSNGVISNRYYIEGKGTLKWEMILKRSRILEQSFGGRFRKLFYG